MLLPTRRSASALAASGVMAAVAAAPGLAGWASSAATGPQNVSTASLAAPTNVAAARGACTVLNAASLTVIVTWTASATPQVQGYSILRGTSATGPFTAVGTTTGINATTWTDATHQLAFSTTYYYGVRSTVSAWTSSSAGPASVATPSTVCVI